MSTQVEALYSLPNRKEGPEETLSLLQRMDQKGSWSYNESGIVGPIFHNGVALARRYAEVLTYSPEVSWCDFLSNPKVQSQVLEQFFQLAGLLNVDTFIVFPNTGYEISIVEDLATEGLSYPSIKQILLSDFAHQLLQLEVLKIQISSADEACDVDGFLLLDSGVG